MLNWVSKLWYVIASAPPPYYKYIFTMQKSWIRLYSLSPSCAFTLGSLICWWDMIPMWVTDTLTIMTGLERVDPGLDPSRMTGRQYSARPGMTKYGSSLPPCGRHPFLFRNWANWRCMCAMISSLSLSYMPYQYSSNIEGARYHDPVGDSEWSTDLAGVKWNAQSVSQLSE